jgi:hypothetical protein
VEVLENNDLKTPRSKPTQKEKPKCNVETVGTVLGAELAVTGVVPPGRVREWAEATPAKKSNPLAGSKLPPPNPDPREVIDEANSMPNLLNCRCI